MAMCDDAVENSQNPIWWAPIISQPRSEDRQNVETNAWAFKVEMKFFKVYKFYCVINLSKMCIGKQDVH